MFRKNNGLGTVKSHKLLLSKYFSMKMTFFGKKFTLLVNFNTISTHLSNRGTVVRGDFYSISEQ